MTKLRHLNSQQGTHTGAVLAPSKPTVPSEQKHTNREKRITDPSSSLAKEKRYPIPSFFEYRAKPKEHDSL